MRRLHGLGQVSAQNLAGSLGHRVFCDAWWSLIYRYRRGVECGQFGLAFPQRLQYLHKPIQINACKLSKARRRVVLRRYSKYGRSGKVVEVGRNQLQGSKLLLRRLAGIVGQYFASSPCLTNVLRNFFGFLLARLPTENHLSATTGYEFGR